jgi:methionine aminotransferase
MEKKETIFTTITKLSNEYDAINLGQGFPNFDPDPRMVEIIKSIAGKNIHQYAPMPGNPKLIEKIIGLTDHCYNRKIDTENVLITAGATQAIFTIIAALVEKDDEVVIFDPAYDCYDPPIKINGGKAIHVDLTFPNYRINWEEARQVISEKTKLIILNNPHNPSGAVFENQDILELERILNDFPNLLVLSDEVYEYISFQPHLSLNKFPSIRNRAIIVSSFGKTLHLTGWKIGYIVAETKLLKEIIQVHQYNVFAVNSICQEAIAQFIDFEMVDTLADFFKAKRAIFIKSLETSNFKILNSGGTYFQLLDYTDISDISDNEMALKLIKEHRVASIPVSGFHLNKTDNKVLRFCYGKDDQTLIQAGEKLCQI